MQDCINTTARKTGTFEECSLEEESQMKFDPMLPRGSQL